MTDPAKTDDVRARLERAGRRQVPDPDPAFVDALEARLLAAARIKAAATRPVSTRQLSPGARPWRPAFGLAAGFTAMAFLLAVAAWFGGGDHGAPALELAGARGVEVMLADGTLLVDPDGLLLPDGSVVRVGAGASARIGGVVLEAGDVATIEDRQVRVTRSSLAVASGPSGSLPTGTGLPPNRATPPSAGPSGQATGKPSPPTSASPAPTGRPSTTAVPPATRAPGAQPSIDARSTPSGPPPTAPANLPSMTLSAKATVGAQVGLSWTALDGARRYVLIATTSATTAADPRYPGSPVLGEFAHPPGTPLVVRVGDGTTEVRLLVVALRADGTEVGRSNVARVLLGASLQLQR